MTPSPEFEHAVRYELTSLANVFRIQPGFQTQVREPMEPDQFGGEVIYELGATSINYLTSESPTGAIRYPAVRLKETRWYDPTNEREQLETLGNIDPKMLALYGTMRLATMSDYAANLRGPDLPIIHQRGAYLVGYKDGVDRTNSYNLIEVADSVPLRGHMFPVDPNLAPETGEMSTDKETNEIIETLLSSAQERIDAEHLAIAIRVFNRQPTVIAKFVDTVKDPVI